MYLIDNYNKNIIVWGCVFKKERKKKEWKHPPPPPPPPLSNGVFPIVKVHKIGCNLA